MSRNRIMALVGTLVVLGGGAGAFAMRDRGTDGNNGRAIEYAVAELRDMEILAEAAGQIEPIRVVEVKSKASGEILDLLVDTGDEIAQGTLLATIDPRDVRNAYAQAEADLDVARARLATADAQIRRAEELRRANVVTEQELENAQLEEANARAQYVKARTSLELARERLSDVTIRAPIAGTVISKEVEIGQIIASASQNISGGTNLLTMADLSEMQVRALVDETDLGRIEAGQSARVKVEAYPDRTFRGEVIKIEPQAVVEQNVTMFPVLVRLDNRDGLLRPGMNADVQIEIAMRPGALTVPNAAVVGVREAIPAGAVLGIPEERMQSALRGSMAGAPQIAMADTRAAQADARGAQERGGQPAERAPAAERAQARGEAAAGSGARNDGQMRRPDGAGAGGQARRDGGSDTRPGIVFVATPEGPQPRRVTLGVNDWDHTEIVSGLDPGEQVVLISVARLQQQQEIFMQQMRQRMGGGPFPGAGGGAVRR